MRTVVVEVIAFAQLKGLVGAASRPSIKRNKRVGDMALVFVIKGAVGW